MFVSSQKGETTTNLKDIVTKVAATTQAEIRVESVRVEEEIIETIVRDIVSVRIRVKRIINRDHVQGQIHDLDHVLILRRGQESKIY